ncbi:general substrate transporter [Auriculariales sp. MPI-PUGE-AT-0066]|nr:general substrate transporter [Auriculariales sp. MPI-PUGE-AT-0066]
MVAGYFTASALVALGGFFNGYDTGAIGGVTETQAFIDQMGDSRHSCAGSSSASPCSAGNLADRFGRLRVIVAGSIAYPAPELGMFIIGRLINGVGQGAVGASISTYIVEISPSNRRGMLVAIPQFMVNLGICAGYFTMYGSSRLDSPFSWRIPFIVMAGTGAILAFGSLFLPESPRWLIMHGKRDKAMRSLERLDFAPAEAEKDIFQAADRENTRAGPSMGVIEALRCAFSAEHRHTTLLALMVLSGVQLTGVDAVLYYAPQQASFLASGVSAILMMSISVPGVIFADRWGRRPILLIGGLLLATPLITIGSLYASNAVQAGAGAARWVVVVLIFEFAIAFCATWGLVTRAYASEIQPTRTRATANALGQGLAFLSNWIVAITTPVFLAASTFGIYFLYGFITLALVVMFAAFAPETRNVPLEEIQNNFHPPISAWLSRLKSHAAKFGYHAPSGASASAGPTPVMSTV